MVTKTLFRKIAQLQGDLEQQLHALQDLDNNIIKISEQALLYIDISIRKVKDMVSEHHFESIAEEVHFFKKLKPEFTSKYVYYSAVLDLESHVPQAGEKVVKKYYEGAQQRLKVFYRNHSEFYSYYIREATYLDHKYFVRNAYDLKMNLPQEYYNFDLNFTTSHDHMLACFIANKQLDQYLKKKIERLNKINKVQTMTPLTWSASKVGLTELIYGLYQMRCFNGGNIELSEVIRFVEKSLGTDLGNFHKTIFEIRTRKQGPTKFLNLVTDHLNQYFLNTDGE